MTEANTFTLIGSPWPVIRGSQVVDGACGHKVWFSPPGYAAYLDPALAGHPGYVARAVCEACEPVAPHIEKGGAMFVRGTRAELNRAMGAAAVDQAWAKYGLTEKGLEDD